MRRLIPVLTSALALIALQPLRAEVDEKRIAQLFRPPLGENMLLSPDGKYLAYTEHTGGQLLIVVLEAERLRVSARIVADEDRLIVHSKEKKRAMLRFLDWSGSSRLVFAPSVEIVESAVQPPPAELFEGLPAEARPVMPPPLPPRIFAPILSVNPDGSVPKELVDASTFEVVDEGDIPRVHMRPPEIRGFAAGDRDHLLLEVKGRTSPTDPRPTEIFRLNVNTGKVEPLSRETPGRTYLYDRQGRPRLIRENGQIRTEIYYLHRPPEGRKWERLGGRSQGAAAASFGATVESYFGTRAIPLGFDYDPNILIYASNAGRDTFGVFGLDVTTGAATSLALVHPGRDLVDVATDTPETALVFDQHRQALVGVRAKGVRPTTVWVDPQLAEVQRSLEVNFPQRIAHIVSWDDSRTRFLVRVSGGTDPGRLYLFKRPEKVSVELMRSAPWLPNAELHDTRFFEFQTKEASALSGYLTLPRKPRLNPPPLIIWFASGLPAQPHDAFEPQAQVLADMGFIVCRLNQRGVAGLGAVQRDALRKDIEGAPAADALAVLEWVAGQHRVDRKRVATLGEGLAGQLAVRTVQLHPDVFCCAVAFEPVFDLSAWVQPSADAAGMPSFRQQVDRSFLESGGGGLHKVSATAHADALNHPVFMTVQTAPSSHQQEVVASGVGQLRSQLKRRGIPVTVIDIQRDFAERLPKARARVYRELEEFFNLNLYNPNVKIGPTRVVK